MIFLLSIFTWAMTITAFVRWLCLLGRRLVAEKLLEWLRRFLHSFYTRTGWIT